MERTIKLYRFEKYDEKRVETIKSGKLWFSSPSQFNDINDCRLILEKETEFFFKPESIKAAAQALYQNIDEESHKIIDKSFPMLIGNKHSNAPENEGIIDRCIRWAGQFKDRVKRNSRRIPNKV